MVDNPFARENILAVTFAEHSNAYEALNRLKELDASGDEVEVRGAAVVVRQDDGSLVTKEESGADSWVGTASGGLIGLLIGVLGGPLGIIIGGASGVLVGSLFDLDDSDEVESSLAEISKSIKVGNPSLLADVIESNPTAIDAVMANLGGDVLRRPAADVQAELAAAEEAQREAKKKARKELRDARHKKHKEEVDTKVAEMKAKLHRHKKSAAAS